MCRVMPLFVVFEGFGEHLFDDLGFLFFDFETWEGFFTCIGRGSLSCIWIGEGFFVLDLDLGRFPLWRS